MPDFSELYEQALGGGQQPSNNAQPVSDPDFATMTPEHVDQVESLQPDEQNPAEVSIANRPHSPEQEEQIKRDAVGRAQAGSHSMDNTYDVQSDPTSLTPEETMRSFIDESTRSIFRGAGKYVIKGAGDIAQVVGGALPGVNMKEGNFISHLLQETGEDLASQYETFIPEELKHENLTWSSLLDPKFWSVHAAEQIPQLYGFVKAAGAGGALARKGARGVAGGLDGIAGTTAKKAMGKEVLGSATGLAGKMTGATGQALFDTVGGGISSNLLAGAINAAELVNSSKDLKNEDGSPMFTEDELGNMAVGSMVNNMKWMGADMLSWGITYGKLGKRISQQLKGATRTSPAERMAMSSKSFGYQVNPLLSKVVKGVGGTAGKMAFEGTEETFQETWEEWAKKRAFAEATGDPDSDMFDMEFFDFYMSDENRATRIMSAAMGALGAGAATMPSFDIDVKGIINKSANENYKAHQRNENLAKVFAHSQEAEKTYHEYYKRDQVTDIVIDDDIPADQKQSLFKGVLRKMEEDGTLDEEQKAILQENFNKALEIKAKGEKLNVKGLRALVQADNDVRFFEHMMGQYAQEAADQKAIITEAAAETGENVEQKLAQIDKNLQINLQNVAALKAYSTEQRTNLLLGKKASKLDLVVEKDEFGNEIMTGGLSTSQFKDWTKEGSKKGALINFENLTRKGKEMVKGAVDTFNGAKDTVKKKLDEKKEEFKEGYFWEGIKEVEVTPEEFENFTNTGEVSDEILTSIAKKIAGKSKSPITDQEKAIQVAKGPEIEAKLQSFQEKENAGSKKTDKTKPSKEAPETSEDNNEEVEITDENEGEQKFLKAQQKAANVFGNVKKYVSGKYNSITKAIGDASKDGETTTKTVQDNLDKLDKYLQQKDLPKSMKDKGSKLIAQAKELASKKMDPKTKAKFGKIMQEIKSLGNVTPPKTLKDQEEKRNEEAESNFKVDQSKIDAVEKEARADNEPMEARGIIGQAQDRFQSELQKKQNAMAVKKNVVDQAKNQALREKVKSLNGNSKTEVEISQDEIDNYLNRRSTINLNGPSDVDKMSAVNHAIKNIFPTVNGSPVRALITRNLFDTLGSQGVGLALGSTMFIDSKVWNQDWVFMHELSHIYFQLGLANGDTDILKIAKKFMDNKPLVEEVKKKYGDMVVFDQKLPDGTKVQRTQKSIMAAIVQGQKVKSLSDAREQFEKMKSSGEITELPLGNQRYIVEEVFTHSLQGPLSENFDKTFNPKNENRRQRYTKRFWGLLRKRVDEDYGPDNVRTLLKKLTDNQDFEGDMKDFVLASFREASNGVIMNAEEMEARVTELDEEYQAARAEIDARVKASLAQEGDWTEQMTQEEKINAWEEAQIGLEENADAFLNMDHDKRILRATKLINRFSQVYMKSLRSQRMKKTVGDDKPSKWQKIDYDKDLFKAHIFELASENDRTDFIYNIENSMIEEVRAFNRYLDNVHPDSKEKILNSMHLVLTNGRNISGVKMAITKNGVEVYDSLSSPEADYVQNEVMRKLGNIFKKMKAGTVTTEERVTINNLKDAIDRIYNRKGTAEDYRTILKTFSGPRVRLGRILEEGSLIYKGMRLPIETVITTMVRRGHFYYKNQNGTLNRNNITVYGNGQGEGGKFLATAIMNTNRRFTPHSMILNAENNSESVRITNNNLTIEVDGMIDFLSGRTTGKKPSEEEFLKRYSHVNYKAQRSSKGKGDDNRLLKYIYNNYQKGIMPTVSQDHGLRDAANQKGSTFKDSSAVEQRIKDFALFLDGTITSTGTRSQNYLGNMGAFSDSPRKFYMNMPRVDYDEIFKDGGFNKDGKVLGNMFELHKKMYNDDLSKSRPKFNKALKKAIRNQVNFIEQNSDVLKKGKHADLFKENGKLTVKAKKLIAEFEVSQALNGYNIADAFLPGVAGKNVTKRNKMNGSPVVGFKNPNLKVEWMPFADEFSNGSIAGTDSGQYILEEDAEKIRNAGKGVFEMKDGFKILNASIEKDNPHFQGKSAYMKGFTTIVDKNHPLHAAMTARKKKYREWHQKTYGSDPSQDITDGMPNHIIIASPQSADKNGFFEELMDDKTGEFKTAKMAGVEVDGSQMTPEALRNNPEYINKAMDAMYYSPAGNFVGIASDNFGPQQVMNGVEDITGTPVQMINSVLVNAQALGFMDQAIEIQTLISDQKWQNLQKVLDKIKDHNPETYKEILSKAMDKENMDQGQRIMIESGGSLAAPYNNEIMVNTLARLIRKHGNKLSTPGAIAIQKPDISYNPEKTVVSSKLGGGEVTADGGTTPFEMVAPHGMEKNGLKARSLFTVNNMAGQSAIRNKKAGWSSKKKSEGELSSSRAHDEMKAIKEAAISEAKRRFGAEKAASMVKPYYNDQKVLEGYQVSGSVVIATRVPSHGPASTGVFEIVDFDKNPEANQVMVPAEFNNIIGADNDGDALFIQTKSKEKDYAKWNEAHDKIVDLWLSPQMSDQIKAKMEFDDDIKNLVADLKADFGEEMADPFPFSSDYKAKEYNNTMVAKRSVGVVFNIHKIANLLAAYETEFTKGKKITIDGQDYEKFQDGEPGKNSRNHKSAILSNVILDNSKYQYADALGINEHNVSYASLMINMGMSMEDVGRILNSKAAKLWTEENRYNGSLFHQGKTRNEIVKSIYSQLGADKPDGSVKIDTKLTHEPKAGPNAAYNNTQANIVALFEQLSDMNEEVQAVSKIMGGHNNIHVNPLVLEEQLKKYRETVENKRDPKKKTLNFTVEFQNNPDLANYVRVAEATLEHTKTLNPAYREATNKMFTDLRSKIGSELSEKQIEDVSRDITKWVTSRLLGHNNSERNYVSNLLNPASDTSVYAKVNEFVEDLKNEANIPDDYKEQGMELSDFRNSFERSILFSKALSLNLNTSDVAGVGIYASREFMSDSLTKEEVEQARAEFQELPSDLKKALITYDLVERGWKGPNSLFPFFGNNFLGDLNMMADMDMQNKNSETVSPKILRELETTIALKYAQSRSNPIDKVYVGGDVVSDRKVKDKVSGKRAILGRLYRNYTSGLYVNVKGRNKFGEVSKLMEIPAFSKDDISQFTRLKGEDQKKFMQAYIIDNMVEIPNTLIGNGNINLVTIADNKTSSPHFPEDFEKNKGVDHIVEATIASEAREGEIYSMEARVDYDSEEFWQQAPLNQAQYDHAMEYNDAVSDAKKKALYDDYLKQKSKANEIAKTLNLEGKTTEELLSMYEQYGEHDAYAYSIVMTPILKKIVGNLTYDQMQLFEKHGVDPRTEDKDVSWLNSYLISGSTIPSNHPAAQAMARKLEVEYKNFIGEKKKYIGKMNELTQKLYEEKFDYGKNKVIRYLKKMRDNIFYRGDIYNQLYGGLVIREENVDPKTGKITYDFRLRPKEEIEFDFKRGSISQAEKDFYDFFTETTGQLKTHAKKDLEGYIPHTAMSTVEAFGARGLFGLFGHSRGENEALGDVHLYHTDIRGEKRLMSFKEIEDQYRSEAVHKFHKADIGKILEYKKVKRKALKQLKKGKNEDGTPVRLSNVAAESVLGFGAVNRFANNRSEKATEMPSMDLNKALGDYIHSTLFVNGNENFTGMRKLQGLVDGVLAYNRSKGYSNLNNHIQKVWKDYHVRNQRQESFLGRKTDNVIRTMTNMNLFYSLGYQANKGTGGLYAVGNILVGKYHNVKDLGGRAWIKGEARFWGLDKGFEGGIPGVINRFKRSQRMMKSMNFMDINVYDEINFEKREGLDKQIGDLALMPMIASENWIQRVHMLGMLTDEELNMFDEQGNLKEGQYFDNDRLVELEDRVKGFHGRGYQPTDQRAIQMYSWGNMMMQFSKFLPTMIHERFAKKDVNIYGREHIGSLRAVGHAVRDVVNNPDGKSIMEYYKSLSPEQQDRLKSGLRGMSLTALIGMVGYSGSKMAEDLYWDSNYYFNADKLEYKLIPPAIRSTDMLVSKLF